METLGFCILTSVFVACDAYLFSQGYNTLFFKHKTDEEKRIREAIIKKMEGAQNEKKTTQ
jgi:hypothetical protein